MEWPRGNITDYRDRNHSYSQIAAYESAGFNLTGKGRPLRINAAAVSASVFPLLGVSPALGRGFTADEDRYGAGNVVVLSSRSSAEHEYGGDPNILGESVKLDGIPTP